MLSHPAVALCIGIWLVNDHVLKQSFGSWWTGKLTDVVALVAFPLLIATAIERRTPHPIHLAIGFTTIFYSAINLWAPADAATEWVMSLVIDSRLTRDPSDLAVLPAMIGAWWLWHRAGRQAPPLRRSWGRAIFLIGVATTLATSPDTASSETFRGTVLLTEDQPSVTIPFSLTLDGEPATDVWAVFPEVTYTSFSDSPPVSPDRDAVSVERTLISDGNGNIVIELTQLELAPVEVAWEVHALTEGDGGLFFGDSAAEPLLSVDPPPDEAGPTAVSSFVVPAPTDEQSVTVWEWPVTIDPGSEVTVAVPSGTSNEFGAATDEGSIQLQPGFLATVPIPRSCEGSGRCSFSIWLTTRSVWDDLEVDLHGPSTMTADVPVQHKMVLTSRTFLTDPVSSDVETVVAFPAQLRLPEPPTPLDAAIGYFRLVVGPSEPNEGFDSDELRGGAEVLIADLAQPWRPQPIATCCEPVVIEVRLFAYDDKNNYDVAETLGQVVVEVWALESLDPAGIELVFTD